MVEKMSLDPQRTFLYLSTDSETGDTGRYVYRLFIVRLYFSLHYKLYEVDGCRCSNGLTEWAEAHTA